jgi:hypothetical protein
VEEGTAKKEGELEKKEIEKNMWKKGEERKKKERM